MLIKLRQDTFIILQEWEQKLTQQRNWLNKIDITCVYKSLKYSVRYRDIANVVQAVGFYLYVIISVR